MHHTRSLKAAFWESENKAYKAQTSMILRQICHDVVVLAAGTDERIHEDKEAIEALYHSDSNLDVSTEGNAVNSEIFARGLFSHRRSFMKIKSSQNGEITLLFTDIGKSCPSHKFLTSQIYLLM